MDLNNLRDTVSNLTLYDIKAGVRKVQNGKQRDATDGCGFERRLTMFLTAVMNYTEMESKVHPALHTA